jgi:hypothetical protein
MPACLTRYAAASRSGFRVLPDRRQAARPLMAGRPAEIKDVRFAFAAGQLLVNVMFP